MEMTHRHWEQKTPRHRSSLPLEGATDQRVPLEKMHWVFKIRSSGDTCPDRPTHQRRDDQTTALQLCESDVTVCGSIRDVLLHNEKREQVHLVDPADCGRDSVVLPGLRHRKFTRLPHLAGTEQNLKYAEQIKNEWQEFGLDSVEMVPYDVLLSYPNKSRPNYISIVDQLGNEVFNTSLAEPVPEGYEDVADIVPPYSAFSAKGQPEGDLVYVNYGRTEDFFQLQREMGINPTGKIVIVRYGKIFRGNKPYPDGWNLPGGGAQRGNVLNLNGAGDPLTPGYPAKEYVNYLPFNRNMGGHIPPNNWKGALNVSYKIGPGFANDFQSQKVRMNIHTNNQVTRIYNVIGRIRGALEPVEQKRP
ncbi:hypothetical protein F2P81_017281 [Scophthalmus maximus]|uniref:PA domain-containing protein n=1 Tax=Scophthalmus maximus TaxID=52904 RepID=A0A6A4SFD0_SCOMX|nr:hypothetical protein F2P81_017281 [Scophthalmus maximus]